MAATTIAQDNFTRANNASSWGIGSDGSFGPNQSQTTYNTVGVSGFVYAISGNKCTVTGAASSGLALYGTAQPNTCDIYVTAMVSNAAQDAFGVTFSYSVGQTTNYIFTGLGLGLFYVQKIPGGTNYTYQSATISNNTLYTQHIQIVGNTLNMRYWLASQSEPTTWNLTTTSSDFTVPGQLGPHFSLGNAADVVSFTSFKVTCNITPNLYVAPTGSDSNPGTQAAPFLTLQYAFNQMMPGCTLNVAAGTYNVGGFGGSTLTSKIGGTLAYPVTYVSTTPLAAKIVASGATYTGIPPGQTPTGVQYVWQNYGNYAIMQGFDMTGDGRSGTVNFGSYCTVLNCYVHDIPANPVSSVGGAGLQHDTVAFYNNTVGCRINNIGTVNAAFPVGQVQGIYQSSYGGTIFNTIVANCVDGWGIHLWHNCAQVQIFNNLCFNNSQGGFMLGSDLIAVTGVTFANNIAYNNYGTGAAGYGFNETFTAPGSITGSNTYTNNCAFGNTSGAFRPDGTGTHLIYSHLSMLNPVTVDPQFVNYQANNSGDYHLKANSPCINAGISSGAPATDYSNAFRSLKGTIDIGPYLFFHSALFPATSRRSGVFPTTARRTGVVPTTNRRGT